MLARQLLIAQTARHRYAFERGDVLDIRLVGANGLAEPDERGQLPVNIELGPLFDPEDRSTLQRWRALIVPIRRRRVALLVDGIDQIAAETRAVPLPGVLRAALTQPWAIGALALEETVIVQLDLRAVVRSALASASLNL